MKNKDISSELLEAWEETYKKGQLTLWIFLALRDGRKFVSEIKDFIDSKTGHTIQAEEQSLYRALRKHEYVKVVDHEMRPGQGGPERKYYYLTPMGATLLKTFIERNISLFFEPDIQFLLTNPSEK